MAFLSGSQKFGEKGGEIGHRCVSCTQADGIWVDQDPLQGLWGLQRCPLPLALLPPEILGAGVAL